VPTPRLQASSWWDAARTASLKSIPCIRRAAGRALVRMGHTLGPI
jgi:hypothetical protein